MVLSRNKSTIAQALGIKKAELDALRYLEGEHRDSSGNPDFYYLTFYDDNPLHIMERVQGMVGNTVVLPCWLFENSSGCRKSGRCQA